MATYPQGAPVWAHVTTPDLEGAKRFYSELFGWTYSKTSSDFANYTQALSDGKVVAAILPTDPADGLDPHWTVFLKSSDLNGTLDKIRDNGGKVLIETTKLGAFGTMAVAADSTGLVFGVWQGDMHPGFEKRDEPGSFAWAEVATRDTKTADSFFPAVFGYKTNPVGGAIYDYAVYESEGQGVLARYEIPEGAPVGLPPYLGVQFAVSDVDASLKTVTKLGGEVRRQPKDSPFGRFAVVSDPQNVTFAIIDHSKKVG